MKLLFIELKIQDGEREHNHKCLHETNCENINFAAELYAAKFWGYSYRENDYWWSQGGEITVKLESVVEITKTDYILLESLYYGGYKKEEREHETVQSFIEAFYPSYEVCDDIATWGDLEKLKDNEYEEGDCADQLFKSDYQFKNIPAHAIQRDFERLSASIYEKAILGFITRDI